MKGDYVDVTVRTGGSTGVTTTRIQAERDGARVVTTPPRQSDLYLEVEEQGKTGKTIRKALFAKGDVVSLIEGNAPVGGKKRTARKVAPDA